GTTWRTVGRFWRRLRNRRSRSSSSVIRWPRRPMWISVCGPLQRRFRPESSTEFRSSPPLRVPSGSRCTSSEGPRRFLFRPQDSARRVRSRGYSRTVVPVSTRPGASRPLNGRLREFRDPVYSPERHLEGVGSGIVLASPLLPEARHRFPMNRLRDVPLTRVRTTRKLLQDGVGGHRLMERTHRNHHIRFHEAGKIAFVDPRMMILVACFAQEVVVVALDR